MERLKIYMAPLQGLTEAPYRNAFEKHFGGVDVYYTPFIRWEHGGLRRKDVRDLHPDANKVGHLVPQIIAASAEEAEQILAQVVPYGYQEVDLNMGCAFPMLVKKGKGCGLLPEPERVRGLLQVVERYPDISFSVKMRLGYENAAECMELLSVLNETRLSRVVVHARTGRQQYKGECDREAFLRFARECRHPVVYNGDVTTVESLSELQQGMPFLEGVMMGRGLLAAPWVAIEYHEGAAEMKQSLSAFERWCDNLMIQRIRPQLYNAFGIGPLAAYILARESEIKSVRIVLSGKKNHLPDQSIRERVRETYV